MNLEQIIDQWIGEEKEVFFSKREKLMDLAMKSNKDKQFIYSSPLMVEAGYNAKIQDLKSRKQELIEGMTSFLEKEVTNLSYEHANTARHGNEPQDAYDRVLDFINDLKQKVQ